MLEPFRGIFPSAALGGNGSVIDFAVVFAIIIYGIFAMLVQSVVDWLDRRIAEHRSDLLPRTKRNTRSRPPATPAPHDPGTRGPGSSARHGQRTRSAARPVTP